MFNFFVVNNPSFSFDENILEDILSLVSKTILKEQNGVLEIIFVEPEYIKNLNKTYRSIDKETDVLSFHYFDNFDKNLVGQTIGEIVLCEEKIKQQADEYGLGVEKEFFKLFIHSVLHILGFDHEKDDDYEKMKKFEDEIWDKLFEKNQI